MVSTTNEEVLQQVNPVEAQLQEQHQASSETVPATEDEWERAQKLFQLGKKNLFLNKYDESVNNIGDACKAFAAKYGEMDPKCAEVYFFYGRALLELARVESTVLGNALTGVPEETESEAVNDSRYGNPDDVAVEEKNEIAEKVIDALCNNNTDDNKTEEMATTTTTTAAVETAAAVPVATEAAVEGAAAAAAVVEPTGEAAAAATATEGEEEEGEEDEGDEEEEVGGEEEAAAAEEAAANAAEDADDITNLQSSWEMFELAKLIYTNQNAAEVDAVWRSKRIAECLLKLGEISIEQEQYEQAWTDITESIRWQEELASGDRDERMLAESYYQLGLARQFANQFAEANEAYQRSINIVQLRVEKLRGRLAALPAEETEDVKLERAGLNDEIADLDTLLPEMTSKLEEVNEQGQQTLQLIREAKECFTSSVVNGAAVPVVVNGDVKDITSLVKSKRKNESGEEEDGATKKTRLSTEGTEEQPAATGSTWSASDKPCEENKENTVAAEVCMDAVESKVESSNAMAVTEEPVVAAEPVATA